MPKLAAAASRLSAQRWKKLAIHALHDLSLLGVDIKLIDGVTDQTIREVEEYSREQTSYS